ncbi:MAG: isoprenylcysteine carboxylmethyltransferase family protein [Clostridia bacterium]|nr:isoprenylcysteine carboxylmethyltransferase family protein [Clostridia bacterium]
MNIKLFFQAIIKYVIGVLIVGSLLFIPANTFQYWNGWLFMGLLFIPMFIAGLFLMIKNPELLKKRLNAREKENEQKQVIAFSGLMFVSGFIVAGLNYRYSWIVIPNIVVIIASILFIVAYILYAEVLRENTYLSRTIEVQENQKVIDTGLYGIVRHPMYAVTLLLFLTIPLILGSIISFLIFLIYPIIIAKRIKNEEAVLERDLKGYTEYKKKVKYKMIPFGQLGRPFLTKKRDGQKRTSQLTKKRGEFNG